MKLFLLLDALLLWGASAATGNDGGNMVPVRQKHQAFLALPGVVRAAVHAPAPVMKQFELQRAPAAERDQRKQRTEVSLLAARAHSSNTSDVPDMSPEEIEAAYDETKVSLRNRADDYVRIDSTMHETAQDLTSNSTHLNVSVERNVHDLGSAVDVAEDQFKTVREDIVAQAHANYSDSLMTAHGAERHGMTPEMQNVMKLEDELHALKRQGDAIFDGWISSDVTPTVTNPPTADLGTGGTDS